jgi:two-component system CheB/CheR fusion protein
MSKSFGITEHRQRHPRRGGRRTDYVVSTAIAYHRGPGQAQATVGKQEPLNMAPKTIRALVVDDDRDTADSAVLLLQLLDCEARAACSHTAALRCAADFDPNVIFMDLAMPGKDGYRLGQELKKMCPKCKIIIISGFGGPEMFRRSREAGFDGHLIKPVDAAQLRRAIGRGLGRG